MTTPRIGFIQGRLSPLVDGKIQAFPAAHWREEYPAAQALGIGLMEWTLDHEGLYENPYMTAEGQEEIRALAATHGVDMDSVTGDCFMQRPFWKTGEAYEELVQVMLDVVEASAALGVRDVVVPLVDNGRLNTVGEEGALIEGMGRIEPVLRERGVRIVFESDFSPVELARLIGRLPEDVFGINYDIGNSAALGYDPAEEMAAYGARICNVHMKDRLLGGTTVPLGTGAANLPAAVRALVAAGYAGNWILQTARAEDGDHAGALGRYAAMTAGWIAEAKGDA